MNKKLHLLATIVLAFGLMAPTSIQAAGFIDNFLGWFSTTAGASAGYEVGRAAGRGVSNQVGQLIQGHEGKVLIAGAVALVAYIIYANREDHAEKNNRRAKSCSDKNCSHKRCE